MPFDEWAKENRRAEYGPVRPTPPIDRKTYLLPFGQFVGKLLSAADSLYLGWLHSQEWVSESLADAIAEELASRPKSRKSGRKPRKPRKPRQPRARRLKP